MMRDDRSNLGEIWMNSSEKPQELGQQKFSTPAPMFGLWIWGIVWGSKNLGIPSNIKTIYRYTDAKNHGILGIPPIFGQTHIYIHTIWNIRSTPTAQR